MFYLYYSLVSICFEFNYLFLELAMMLNIGIWVYFYLKIQTHRDIRYDEINEALMYEQEDSIKDTKSEHLDKLK